MKSLIILFLFSFILPLSASNHLWKKRIVIVFSNDNLSKEWVKNQKGIIDRDIVYYQINSDNELTTNNKTKLNSEHAKEIREKYFIKNDQLVLLIGKDGGIKSRARKLDLKSIFALIDTMPMRQREIQEMKEKK